MIKTIFFFPNGAVAVTDEKGEQVPEWQTNLLQDHLRKMRDAGVIAADTEVNTGAVSHTTQSTVRDWIGEPRFYER